MSASQPPASEQYASWKKYPHTYAEPTHEDWERENADLKVKLEAAQREIKEHNDGCASACKARHESGACAYRNADGSSRYGNKRCHDCPQEYAIDAAMQSVAPLGVPE